MNETVRAPVRAALTIAFVAGFLLSCTGNKFDPMSVGTKPLGYLKAITITPAAGSYTTAQTLSAGSTDSGAEIYYTLDGSEPQCVYSSKYTAAISVSVGITFKARACKPGFEKSDVASYTVTAPGANANLTSLDITFAAYSPSFSADTTSYTASVNNAVTAVQVTPVLADANAAVKVNTVSVASGAQSAAISLNVGVNTITVEVTAQNTTTVKTYTVSINRLPATSNNANLSSLTLSSGTLSPVFAAGSVSYTTTVTDVTGNITVTAVKADANATLKYRMNGSVFADLTSAVASSNIALNGGENILEVLCTAQDGSTEKTYTVTITRTLSANNNSNLTALVINTIAFTPAFNTNVRTYSYTDDTVNSVTVTATKDAAGATINLSVNGAAPTLLTSGVASGSVSTPVGITTLEIKVIAVDGGIKTYTVTINRNDPSNAFLSAITPNDGSLDPVFNGNTTTYTISVAYNITSTTLAATLADSRASLKINNVTTASGVQSASIPLAVGNNSVTILVTALNGTTTKTYNVTVNRAKAQWGVQKWNEFQWNN